MDAFQGFVDTVSTPRLNLYSGNCLPILPKKALRAVVIDPGFVLVELAPVSMNLP